MFRTVSYGFGSLYPSRLTRYCIVLAKKPNVLKSTNIMDDEQKEYNAVLITSSSSEEMSFSREHDLITDASSRESQQNNTYIIELYNLAEQCNYGDLKSKMIQNLLVLSILDKNLSEHLQLDPYLMLEVAKKEICQCKAVQTAAGAKRSSLEEVKQSHFRSQKARESGKSQYKHDRNI